MDEATEKLITNITGWVCAAITIAFLIFTCIYFAKLNTKRKKYIETLNEHDKAVICDYQNIKVFEKKEGNK